MYVGPNGRTRSLPVGWTSVAPVDPFISVAAGRAPFRLEDLLALTALLRDLHPQGTRSSASEEGRCQVNYAVHVYEIMPMRETTQPRRATASIRGSRSAD